MKHKSYHLAVIVVIGYVSSFLLDVNFSRVGTILYASVFSVKCLAQSRCSANAC